MRQPKIGHTFKRAHPSRNSQPRLKNITEILTRLVHCPVARDFLPEFRCCLFQFRIFLVAPILPFPHFSHPLLAFRNSYFLAPFKLFLNSTLFCLFYIVCLT
ncbi:hypothetical protein METBIDRAFT_90587 [Metschnikowia bicuspidata var. bicuspidata NRRL YB-4993]|uniref:Uncharacterized protein n=1 Tax=Metschnikowia bicuspidata var. bicuspidata NRRL YB-4993 TaxID=869754 RepID=A0A1A0HFD5_9ASCO|nr:hypothetical protein METBIDRAFT_90587 [Metschnikowia bicuspidata var. bicuspidata NRRL YB-4993]OBA22711.1 hypothetical protein METBIDRAFT_90587 [Metschnikowia bicuspidata var. bicuspidata NRRL YB-4993]